MQNSESLPYLIIIALIIYAFGALFMSTFFAGCLHVSIFHYFVTYFIFWGTKGHLSTSLTSVVQSYSLLGICFLSALQIVRWCFYRTPYRPLSAAPLIVFLLLWSSWIAMGNIEFLFWFLVLLLAMAFVYWKGRGIGDERPLFLKLLAGLWVIINMCFLGPCKFFNFALGGVGFFCVSLLRKRIRDKTYTKKEEINHSGRLEIDAMTAFSSAQQGVVFSLSGALFHVQIIEIDVEVCALFFAVLPLFASEVMLNLWDSFDLLNKNELPKD